MPNKTPGERLVEEWEMVCGQLITMDHDELVKRIDTLLAEQIPKLVQVGWRHPNGIAFFQLDEIKQAPMATGLEPVYQIKEHD